MVDFLKSLIALLIPSFKLTLGNQPKSFILLISNNFLGVPSGLDLSHKISP